MNYMKILTFHKSVLVLLILTIVFEFLEYGNSRTEIIKLTKTKGEDKLMNKLANFKTHNVSISSTAYPNDTTNVTAFPVVINDGK